MVVQELIELLPVLPSPEAVQLSLGLLHKGNGRQLMIQLIWLLAVLVWTVLFTAPTIVTLWSVGVLCVNNHEASGMRLMHAVHRRQLCVGLPLWKACRRTWMMKLHAEV